MNNRKYTQDNSIDIDELLGIASSEEAPINTTAKPVAEPAIGYTHSGEGLIVVDDEPADESYATAADILESPAEEEYTGLGAVVDRAEYEAGQAKVNSTGVNVTGMNEDTVSGAKKWIAEADAKIEEAKKIIEENNIDTTKKPGEQSQTPQEIVNIYIDKAQIGEVVFTPEQQKRINMASKINIVETTDLTFKSIKIKRSEKSADKEEDRANKLSIISKAFDRTLSPFIAIGSGYLGKMCSCTTAEIMKLGRAIDSGVSLNSELERWQLLYDKMKYCSIGKFDNFEDFLKNTAYDDYENLQFALICASFPESTTMEFTCQKCKNNFTLTVPNKELLRSDRVDEEMVDIITNIIKSDTFIERAKEVHENASFNVISRVSVEEEDNSILLDLYSPSAYDAIYRTYSELTNPKKDDPDYMAYAQLIKFVNAAYIVTEYDEDGEPLYMEFTEPDEIFDIMINLREVQLNKIANYMNESYMTHRYTYGVKSVVCPNEACKANLGEYPMNMDRLLFLKVQRQ